MKKKKREENGDGMVWGAREELREQQTTQKPTKENITRLKIVFKFRLIVVKIK